MRKLVKLMTSATIISATAMQVTACNDDTKFNTFNNDVNETVKNSSAFLGFLGSADDSLSLLMENAFSFFNTTSNNNNKTRLQEWNNEIKDELKLKNITNINLKYYQGPYHQNKPGDPIESFWKDKEISWQRSIFDWLLYNSKPTNNPNFKTPSGADADVTEIKTKKDDSGKEMFQKLPIVFIVSKGKLITAGQGWNNSQEPEVQIETIKNFILTNLFI